MLTRRRQQIFLDLSQTVICNVHKEHAQNLTLKIAVADAGFVSVGDRIPKSIAGSPPLQPACERLPLVMTPSMSIIA